MNQMHCESNGISSEFLHFTKVRIYLLSETRSIECEFSGSCLERVDENPVEGSREMGQNVLREFLSSVGYMLLSIPMQIFIE